MINEIADTIGKIGIIFQGNVIEKINIKLPCLSDRDDQLKLLNAVEAELVKEGWDKSSYRDKLIILKKNLHKDLVYHDKVVAKPITNPNIIDIFKDNADGKLLIVGDPGSGKTTTLYELTQELIKEARKDKKNLLPVLVNLSSWKKDKRSMRQWLVVQLNKQYGKGRFRKWFAQGKLLPLLDGLDEVKPQYQKDCVLAINKLLEEEDNRPGKFVVCCGIEEYKNLIKDNYDSRIKLFQAIELQELTVQQIQNYLKNIDRKNLWELIKQHGHLLELLCTPLMLNIAIKVYPVLSADKLKQFNSSEKLQPYLFNQYIHTQLNDSSQKNHRDHKGKIPREEDTIRWLIWLAKKLKRRNQKELLIEEIQPDWLPKFSQRIYHIGVFLSLELLFVIIGNLLVQIIDALFWYYLGTAIIALTYALSPTIKIVEGFNLQNWDWKNAKWGLIISLIGSLCFGVMTWIHNEFMPGLKVFLITAAIAGSIVSVISGFTRIEGQRKTYANQGIIKSAQNAIISGVFIGLISTLISIGIHIRIDGVFNLSGVDAICGIIAGLISGLFMGGITCIQHLILRLILYCNGLPWNFADFLNYATQLFFLQRIGGRYQFIHDLLRDHFAIELPRYQNNR